MPKRKSSVVAYQPTVDAVIATLSASSSTATRFPIDLKTGQLDFSSIQRFLEAQPAMNLIKPVSRDQLCRTIWRQLSPTLSSRVGVRSVERQQAIVSRVWDWMRRLYAEPGDYWTVRLVQDDWRRTMIDLFRVETCLYGVAPVPGPVPFRFVCFACLGVAAEQSSPSDGGGDLIHLTSVECHRSILDPTDSSGVRLLTVPPLYYLAGPQRFDGDDEAQNPTRARWRQAHEFVP